MARKHEAAHLLNRGNSPAGIARQMGVSVETVMGYLYNQVGEGKTRRSDILLSIGDDARRAVEMMESQHGQLDRWTFRRIIRREYPEVDPDDALVYRDLRKPEVYLGDMYWYLYIIEAALHLRVRNVLLAAHGEAWWKDGILENIRIDCQIALERDQDKAAEPYCYTTLIHLKEIIDRRWNLFSRCLPKGPASRKQEFLAGLVRMNQVRNRVMHAAKGVVPSEGDFRSLRDFVVFADIANWRAGSAAETLIEGGAVRGIQ